MREKNSDLALWAPRKRFSILPPLLSAALTFPYFPLTLRYARSQGDDFTTHPRHPRRGR